LAERCLAGAVERVARSVSWARAHLSEEVTAGDLADAAGLAPRTFARRLAKATGLSPIRFLQRLRIEAARELIETTRLAIDEVAHRVGYADPSALRRVMARELGVNPSHMRRREVA
jgi:transcriptional regulator GlxA family with amidase domain